MAAKVAVCDATLRKLAEKVAEAKRDINFAREHSNKPKYLLIHARRAAIKAARAVAGDYGFAEITVPPEVKRDKNGVLTDGAAQGDGLD